MSKYRLDWKAAEELLDIYSDNPERRISYLDGVRDEADRLIPLLEQRDQLLIECREFIKKTGLELFDDETTELLDKLKEI